jgi:hypothetical protein
MTRERRLARLLAVTLFLTYAYFYQAGGWNQNSRFALVRAILERHTLQIDAYQLHTGDRAIVDGHYYSDKAPGTSLAALPPAAAARVLARAAGVDPLGFPGIAWTSYVATLFTAGLFTVIAAIAVFRLTIDWGYSTAAALFAAIAFGIGGPAWCYATLFMGHGIAAGCLAAALATVGTINPNEDDGRRRRRLAAIGLACGWAVVTEFQAAVPAAAIALLAIARLRSDTEPLKAARWLVGAGALCAVVLLVYNQTAFGSPFHVGYQSEEQFAEMRRGFFGISAPEWWRVRELLIGSYRGLLPAWPLAALAPVGLALAARHPRRRAAALVALGTVVYYLLLNASYHYWEGGWAYGPRQMMSAMPFVALGLGPLWDAGRTRLRLLLSAAVVFGVALTLVVESTNPQPQATYQQPVRELLWPAFRAGNLSLNTQTFVHIVPEAGPLPDIGVPRAAWNAGEIAGLRGLSSLLPLGALWLAGGWLLWTASRR